MANVIIEHADGRRYSTTDDGFHRLYEDEGFTIVGDESDASFEVTGVAKPRAPRKRPKAKAVRKPAPAPEPPAEPV